MLEGDMGEFVCLLLADLLAVSLEQLISLCAVPLFIPVADCPADLLQAGVLNG